MKKILIVVFSVLCLLFLKAALFLPRYVEVSRTIHINASPKTVFPLIAEAKNWEQWSPWLAQDPLMELSYPEQTEGVGSGFSWKSESQGSGSMRITQSREPNLLNNTFEFDERGRAEASFQLQELKTTSNKAAQEGTSRPNARITWQMTIDMGRSPISKLLGLFVDSTVGPDLEDGLSRLKKTAEAL